MKVDIIARGACSLVPGRQGRVGADLVRSIVGEFLEHSRIWGFENGGEPDWYIGSADLMDRNLDRRVEAIVPVEDPDARARIAEILEVMLADDRRSWQLGTTAPGDGPRRSSAARARRHARGAEGARARGECGGRDAAPSARRRRLARSRAGHLGPRDPAHDDHAGLAPAGRGRAEVPRRRPGRRRSLPRGRGDRGVQPSSAVRSTQLEDRYIDTADGALARAGFAARLRRRRRARRSASSRRSAASHGQCPSPRGARGAGRPDRRTRATGRRRMPVR